MTTTLAAALQYVARGWAVIPLHSIQGDRCTCGKAECPSPGKHPRTKNGVKDASSREDMIEYWFGQWPKSNVGIATGEPSGVWVLDVDRRDFNWASGSWAKDGERGLAELGELPETLTVETGGGGWHLYWTTDPDLPIGCPSTDLEGIDVRGDGGYVVAPPSIHASGDTYAWVDDSDTPLALPAAPLRRVLAGSQPAPSAPAPVIPLPDTPAPDAEILAALDQIDPACDRDTWIQVGMALHDESHGAWLGVWDSWSARAEGQSTPNGNTAYRGSDEVAKQWASFKGRQNPIGRATLFGLAGPVELTFRDPAPESQMASDWPTPVWDWASWESPTMDIDAVIPDSLSWMRTFFSAISDSLQVPVALPAMLGLPIAMAALSGKARVSVPGDTWSEPAVLWTLCVMTSGGRKSPAHRQLIAPLTEWEESIDDSLAIATHRAALSSAEASVSEAEKSVKKALAKADPMAVKLAEKALISAMQQEEIARSTPVPRRTLIAQDATTERLVEIMSQQSGRALISDAEGDVFDTALGRYSAGAANLGPWLKAYDGDTIKQERIAGDRVVQHPLLNVGVATQPQALQILSHDEAVGRGFVARFLPCVVECPEGQTFRARRPITADESRLWGLTLRKLLNWSADTEIDYPLSEAATAAFDAWGEELYAAAAASKAVTHVDSRDSWWRKYPGKVLRVALLYHCLQQDGTQIPEIGEDSMLAAIALCDYAYQQQEVVSLAAADTGDGDMARRILASLAERDLVGREVSSTDIIRNLVGSSNRVRHVGDVAHIIAALVEAHWLRPLGKEVTYSGASIPCWRRYLVRPDLVARMAHIMTGDNEVSP